MTLRRQLSLLMGGFTLVTVIVAAQLAAIVVTNRYRDAADHALRTDLAALRAGITADMVDLTDRMWRLTLGDEDLVDLVQLSGHQLEDWEIFSLAGRIAEHHDFPLLQILDTEGTVLSNHPWQGDYGHRNPDLLAPWPTAAPSPAEREDPGAVLGNARWVDVQERNVVHPALAVGRELRIGDDGYVLTAGLLFTPSALRSRAAAIGATVGLELDNRWYWGSPSGAPDTATRWWDAVRDQAGRHELAGQVQTVPGGNERWRLLVGSMPAAPGATLAVAVSEAPLAQALADLFRTLVLVGVIGLVAALIFAALLAHHLAVPLEVTSAAAGRVATGDLDTHITPLGSHETRLLADSFNRMTAELRADRERLIQAERLGAWRDVARRLAHEIGNALSPIQLSIDSLERTHSARPEELPAVMTRSARIVGEEIERLRRLVREFSGFARAPAPRPEPTDVDGLVGEVVELERTSHDGLALAPQGPAGIAEIDADAVRGALINLIRNALLAAGPEGQVRVRTGGDDETVHVAIEDDGPGIPPADRARIFTPYVSGHEGGTGLGLAIVLRTATDHGGRVELESEVGEGSVFRIILPRRFAGGTRAPTPAAPDQATPEQTQ